MYRISKEFTFSASHQLTHLPGDHQCARLHGHNYKVIVQLKSNSLDKNGFVMDYGLLWVCKRYIDEQLDHRHLNDVLRSSQATTAENLAKHLHGVFDALLFGNTGFSILECVGVSETDKTMAWYGVETTWPEL